MRTKTFSDFFFFFGVTAFDVSLFSLLFASLLLHFPSSIPSCDCYLHETEFCKHFSIFIRRFLLARQCLWAIKWNDIY